MKQGYPILQTAKMVGQVGILLFEFTVLTLDGLQRVITLPNILSDTSLGSFREQSPYPKWQWQTTKMCMYIVVACRKVIGLPVHQGHLGIQKSVKCANG